MTESIDDLQAKIRALIATVAGHASKYRLREIQERLNAMLPAERSDPVLAKDPSPGRP